MSQPSHQMAPVGACTPQKMAQSGVPFDAALTFHTQIARRGPRTRSERNLLHCVRSMVARSP